MRRIAELAAAVALGALVGVLLGVDGGGDWSVQAPRTVTSVAERTVTERPARARANDTTSAGTETSPDGEQERTGAERPRAKKRGRRGRELARASFSGRGTRVIGTIRVRRESVLRWTHAGASFELYAGSKREAAVRSSEHDGALVVPPGSYRRVTVVADGRWSIRLEPS